MRILAKRIALLLTTLAALTPAHGQNAPRATCWRSPTPACRTIVITELGYQRALLFNSRRVAEQNGSIAEESRGFGEQLSWELGVLERIRPRQAIGAVIAFGVTETGGRTALKVRARQFINDRYSFELSAGYLNASVGTFISHPRQSGFTADARFNIDDMFALLITYDDVSWPDSMRGPFAYTDNSSRARALKLGVAAGSLAGVTATGIVALLFGVFALSFPKGS